ncbi:MAG: hypothetical protein CL764_06035 [Chloroflexi bacterium]|nr:hypothetical protein [Chloroflexota bacterium]|tara:strand:+ start:59 stop:1036 length:978 start_codon:yes stop_codon:yes gene_type:complete
MFDFRIAKKNGLDVTRESSIAELTDKFLKIKAKSTSSKTLDGYTNTINIHVLPFLKNVKVTKLNVDRLNDYVDELLNGGRTPATVNRTLKILNQAMTLAMKLSWISENPVTYIDRVKHEKNEINPFSKDELNLFLDNAVDDPFYALWLLKSMSGMRLGELQALTWDDINFETGVIDINKSYDDKHGLGTPKSKSSRRKITINFDCLKALREHQSKQLELQLSLGRYWENLNLVFPSSTGSYSHKSNLRNRSFNVILKKSGLTDRTPHTLRHTFASLMLMSGTPILKVSRYLGHQDITVTSRTYVHYIPNQETDTLADDFSKLLNS